MLEKFYLFKSFSNGNFYRRGISGIFYTTWKAQLLEINYNCFLEFLNFAKGVSQKNFDLT